MSDKKFYIILIILFAAIITAVYFCFVAPPVRRKAPPPETVMPVIARSYAVDKKIVIADGEGKKFEYKIKGVCYGPDINGETFYENYGRDISLVKLCGANSVRTYRPLAAYGPDGSLDKERTQELLDMSFREGITVAAGFSYDDMSGGLLEQYLAAFGDHPALLMVVLGNEYNYHYGEWFSKEEWLGRLAEAVQTVKTLAPGRVVATAHGEMPSKEEYEEYVNAGMDLVMMNIYRGANFGFAKQSWYGISDEMPWVVSEFGRSSKDAEGNDTSTLQASMLQTLIRSMEQGYLFMLTDDPDKGEAETAPNVGREDSLGIFDKDRNPKKAVSTVKTEYGKIVSLRPL